MPPVKNEDLIPGATFTGKVRSIQPFGAFIDFGAFTDGLVHVSRLSDNFVKDVGSIVSVGQEVKVRLIEANAETGRISLTMRESDDISKLQQQKDATAGGDKVRTARRSTSKPGQKRDEMKTTKFVKGQDLEGTVKNLTRSGAFISLPEGEEGFLPTSEESDDGFANMMGGSSLQVGQEVSVRVLRISRGQVTLTMKKEDDVGSNLQLTQGVIHAATNPFVLAFRSNKDISSFLDERDKSATAAKKSEKPTPIEIGGEVSQMEAGSSIPKVQDQPTSSDDGMASVPSAVGETVEDHEAPSKEKGELADIANRNDDPQNVMSGSSETLDGALQTIEKETEETTLNQTIEETPSTDVSGELAEQALSTDGPKAGEFTESQTEDTIAKDEVQILTPATEEKETKDTTEALAPEGSVSTEKQIIGEAASTNLSGEIAEQVSVSDSPKDEEVVQNQTDDVIAKDEEQIQTPTTESEIPSAGSLKEKESGPIPDKNGSITSSGEEPDVSSSQKTKATVSPALVKQLREETGAGMMDCKKALAETGGDIVKAQEFLRKKGLASAEKKASRATAEGRIGSYIHDSRIGVMVEVNCETDFVSRGDIFKELVDDLAMQVAACPQVKYLVTEDVPEEIVNKEKEIEMQKEDLLSKPEQIRSKIVEGRIRKRLEELALLEQPYIKNDKMVVKDWVKQTIATIGENIKVKRFVRYNLGEGLEKKSQDFAAEVAAQTAAKPIAKEQPAPAETKETVEKPPAVAVSAALVKQLREETGAGMMDCKKALSETGGDLEKAQEYLRKKGLSSADKKSGRLAAEGRIGSYIHDSRIGVLIEVNCETDFVGRSEKFKELVDDLAMQAVACPQVQFVSIEDIPEDIINKEKEIEMQREDLISKPENIRERIVEGRITKRLGELALSEQPFIKDDSVLVKDLVKQTVAAIGENIKVRRFVRFTLGETNEETQTETEA
ncbi:polyprotein of EF-Ts [Citrus sinensis]|nr:polyprotein of EF-Ts [Citrus sinensis]